jgi:hypothetical protein
VKKRMACAPLVSELERDNRRDSLVHTKNVDHCIDLRVGPTLQKHRKWYESGTLTIV